MTRPLSDHKLYLQVDDATYRRLKTYALAVGKPMTVVGAMCLAAYLQARAEVGEQIPAVGDPEQPSLVHDLIAGAEERIATTIDNQSKQLVGVVKGVELLQVMLEKAVLSYLQHTPEVPAERKGQAAESGQARLDKWKASVNVALKKGAG